MRQWRYPSDRAWRVHVAQQAARRARLKAAGCCPTCGKAQDDGRVYCSVCRNKAQAKRRKAA